MKLLKCFIKTFAREERGAVIILVALLLVVLLGFAALAVDVGQMYMVRRQMVNAADAAALAGAQEYIYNPDNVEAVAKIFGVELNGADDDNRFKVNIISPGTVEVELGKNIDLTFARFFQQDEAYVAARAVAKVSPLIKGEGIAPFAVYNSEYSAGDEITIKFDHWNEGDIASGNYHMLDLGGKLSDNILYGASEPVEVGEDNWVDTEPGQNWGQVRKPLQDRFDSCGKGEGYHWDAEAGSCDCSNGKDCERVLYIILFDKVKLKPNETEYKPGKTEINVFALAAVYLTHRPGNPDKEVKARFIKTVGQMYGEGDIGSDQDHGLYKVKLIE